MFLQVLIHFLSHQGERIWLQLASPFHQSSIQRRVTLQVGQLHSPLQFHERQFAVFLARSEPHLLLVVLTLRQSYLYEATGCPLKLRQVPVFQLWLY